MMLLFKNRKGQPQSHVLMMVMTLFMIGFVVFFGSKIIGGVMKQGNDINYVKFKNTLQNEIDAITQEYRSRKEINLLMPGNFDKLCIIDLGKHPDEISDTSFKSKYPVIYNYWKDSQGWMGPEGRNVFLVDRYAGASFHVDKIEIEGGYVCIDEKRSRVVFWAEGRGNKAIISFS
ncbi:MAG: hypothetical protein ACLFPQ_01070 [Candidatus Woesearchaeota archaeon]